MLLQEPLTGQEPQPEKQRHRPGPGGTRPDAVLASSIGLLNDVGRVDPPLEPAIQPQGDHALEPVAVLGQQIAPRRLVSLDGAVDQRLHLALTGAGFG